MEFDALLLRVVDLLAAGGHFGLAAAVDEVDLLRAEPEGHARGVHRDVAAAEHGDLLPVPEGRVRLAFEIRLHEVRARQVLVRREDAVQVLALDAHELREACARADEDGVEAVLLHQVTQLARVADDVVRVDRHADLPKPFDLVLDDGLRETEFGDAVDEHAAALVERLEHRDAVAGLGAVRRAGDGGGTRTDDGDALPGLRGTDERFLGVRLAREIGAETLDAADGDGLVHALEELAHRAELLALLLLGADTSAHRRKKGGLLDDPERAREVPGGHLREEAGDVDCNGATLHTGLGGALEAARRLTLRHLGRVAEGDFVHVVGADRRILLGHLLWGQGHSLFGCHGVWVVGVKGS